MLGTLIVLDYLGRWLWVPAFAGTTIDYFYISSATTM